MTKKPLIPSTVGLALLVLALELPSCARAEQGDITLHTVSAHVGVSGLNNINPGVGYDLTDNVRVGGFYNSYRKPSAYVAAFLNIHPRFRVGAGVISGYSFQSEDDETLKSADKPECSGLCGNASGVLPLVAAEFDIVPQKGSRPGVSVVWFGQALNLEVKF
jgi:hypothetical protein